MIMNATEIHQTPKTKKVRHLANFELAESFYQPNLRMPGHAHERAHISVVLSGTYTEQYNRREDRFARPSMLVLHPPDEKHAVVFHNQGARIFSIKIKPRWLAGVRQFSRILDDPLDFNGGLPSALAARIYREFQRMDKYSALVVEGLILEMIAETSREAASKERKIPRWLEQVRESFHARFAENIGLSDITKTAGVHPIHLAREFRRFYQCTMGEYVRRLRVASACEEISNSETPLSEIALKSGFYDQSHLTNTFKQLTGMTPAQYRAVFRSR